MKFLIPLALIFSSCTTLIPSDEMSECDILCEMSADPREYAFVKEIEINNLSKRRVCKCSNGVDVDLRTQTICE